MPAKGTTTERGYDNGHKVNRARMLYNLMDGTKCTYCGKPMYREAALNFDQAPLEADHKHGDKSSPAYRLIHRRCNRSIANHWVEHGPGWYGIEEPQDRPKRPKKPEKARDMRKRFVIEWSF